MTKIKSSLNVEKIASHYIYWPEIDNPFQKNVSFGKNTVSSFIEVLKPVLHSPKTSPEQEIIEFYALNQLLSYQRIVDGNVLTEQMIDFYKLYSNKVNDLSKRMFSYIFSISLMEARHSLDFRVEKNIENYSKDFFKENKKFPSEKQIKEFKQKLIEDIKDDYKKICPIEIYPQFIKTFDFLFKVFEDDSSNVRNKAIEFSTQQMKDCQLSLEDVMTCLCLVFHKNNFVNGFGGKLWEKIAHHGLDYCDGKINSEFFIDQAFSLEHNGGSMFNKNIIFSNMDDFSVKFNYSRSDNLRMSKSGFVLNMQHSSQILNYLGLIKIPMSQINKIIRQEIKENDHEDKLMQEAVSVFYQKMKDHGKILAKSSIINHILQDIPATEYIDWMSFLSYKTIGGETYDYLTPVQEKILNHANKVAQKLKPQLIRKEKSIENFSNFNFFNIQDLPLEKANKESIGNKGYGIYNMKKMNLPVPNALVWPCENFQVYEKNPQSWIKNLKNNFDAIETHLKDNNGNPALCSIRSGAPVSMPGMMDTILNVGIDDDNYEYLCEKMGKSTVDECAIHFMKSFCKSFFEYEGTWPKYISTSLRKFKKLLSKHGINHDLNDNFPLSRQEQILWSMQAIFKSWNSPRAKAYRQHSNISDELGTAILMQQMVFGNLNENSCTGVLFSRDCINGKPGMIGEYCMKAQGEIIVSGEITPKNLIELKKTHPKAYKKLEMIAKNLENKTGQIRDIEFTMQDNEVYILQDRTAVCSDVARLNLAKEQYFNKQINFETFLKHLSPENFMEQDMVFTSETPHHVGLCANPGVIQGVVVKDESSFIEYRQFAYENQLPIILATEKTKPEHAPLMMKCDGFITQKGGFTSHAAILSRTLNKPCIVGAPTISTLKKGQIVTMDSKSGHIWNGLQPIVQVKPDFSQKIICEEKIDLNQFELNQKKTISQLTTSEFWMNFGPSTHIVEKKINKHHQFMDMGNLALLKMSQAAKQIQNKRKILI